LLAPILHKPSLGIYVSFEEEDHQVVLPQMREEELEMAKGLSEFLPVVKEVKPETYYF
jgi:hypothetical protein